MGPGRERVRARVRGRRSADGAGRSLDVAAAPTSVIAADSGLGHAHALGVPVDLVVGDLDSVDPAELDAAESPTARRSSATPPRRTPPISSSRSTPPSTAARTRGRRASACGGGRLDHFLANVLLLASPRLRGTCASRPDVGDAHVIVVRDRRRARRRTRARCARSSRSAAPPTACAPTGCASRSAGETLHPASTRGVSNEFLGDDRAPCPSTDGVLLAVLPTPGTSRPRKGRLMRRLLLALVVIASAVPRSTRRRGVGARPPTTITLVTHDSFAVSKSVLRRVHEADRHQGEGPAGGDAGAALNQVILTKSNPIGDVFFGVDNTFLSRALDAGVFAKYAPSALVDRARRVPARPVPPPHADRPRRRVHQLRQAVVRRARSSRCRRRSTTSPSPRTRGCSWSRTRRRRRRVSRSSSRPSPSTATTAGATTGPSCAPTT